MDLPEQEPVGAGHDFFRAATLRADRLERNFSITVLGRSNGNAQAFKCIFGQPPSISRPNHPSFEGGPTQTKLRFHQLIVDELICVRLKTKIAAEWTIQGEDDENDHPDEKRQQDYLNSL